MKLNVHITLTVLSGVILAGLLAGCSMPKKEDIAKNTTEFNLVAEKAGNEMLLLNIVRASKRRPMYFTSFGKLTGQMSFEVGTGGINIPFGKSFEDPYSIAPNVSYKYSPFFDVAVLDTQEFTNGIMTPVPMKIIEYYRSQGWPPEILLHIFIRRIEITDEKGYVQEEYNNYPENQIEFEKFQNQIRDAQWDIEVIPNLLKIGKVDANEASKLQNLIKVQKEGLTLTPVKDNNKKVADTTTSTGEVDANEVPIPPNQINAPKAGSTPTPSKSKMELRLSEDKYVFTRKMKRGEKIETIPFDEEKEGKIYTRSPEAILYYLGEIMRVENRTENPYIPMIDVSHDRSCALPARLFYARKATDKVVTPCVSVDYEGTRYIIPGDPTPDDGRCTDRSMHVLSLVSQLIGLHKKSSEAPTTTTVSVIGR